MARMTALGEEASNRRDDILDVALRLFAERGVEATSMADIAQEVGITKPTLYHYFRGKIEILETLLTQKTFLMEDLPAVLAGDEPLSERIARVAEQYLDRICTEPDLGHVILRESLGVARHSAAEGIKQKFVDRYYGRIAIVEKCLRAEEELASVPDRQIRLFSEILFDSLALFWLRRVLVQRETPTEDERHEYAQGLVGWLMQSEGLAVA